MADVEKLALERRCFQWILLVLGAIWCGALMLKTGPWFGPGTHQVLSIVYTVFCLLWGVVLFRFVFWLRRVKAQPQVFAALNDEMAVHNHWRAQRASRAVLLTSLSLGIAITAFVKINALPVLVALTWIVSVSQLGFTLWYDRSE